MHAYLAAPEREAELLAELEFSKAQIVERHERLLLAEGGPSNAAWASNIWYDVERLFIDSIGDGARQLQRRQRNWALYSVAHHRRAQLIRDKLPHVSAKPLEFGQRPPTAPLGSWTLLEPNQILASASCRSAFGNGEVEFVEDKLAPPSRAYLKLWEVFTLTGRQPVKGERCLDLGSSPGGWTYVLASLGATVISVDKAPLAPSVARMPNVQFRQQSAFALEPEAFPKVDWLFSDVICYPTRLFETIARWRAQGNVRNFVCTLKFQGETDHETARRFAALPGSQLVHLHHNRHELTWICLSAE
ncbi:MAG TPA: SAM-dependent methyltransferase [Polyangiaceae bacterium]|nr:SAM-dependent methyltransferase [Polyangiaceae bacterium]